MLPFRIRGTEERANDHDQAKGKWDPEEDTMSVETIVIWIAIGLVAGWLASLVVGGGYGVVGDIVLGIVGAFLGGFIFRALHLGTPFRGVASTIFVAFVGSVVVLLLMRLVSRTTARCR